MKPPRTAGINGQDSNNMMELMSKVLAGNVTFGQTMNNAEQGQNINGWKSSDTSPVGPNTEFAVPHQLGRVPIGFIVISTSLPGHIYRSATPWTITNIYLKCDAAAVPYALVVI